MPSSDRRLSDLKDAVNYNTSILQEVEHGVQVAKQDFKRIGETENNIRRLLNEIEELENVRDTSNAEYEAWLGNYNRAVLELQALSQQSRKRLRDAGNTEMSAQQKYNRAKRYIGSLKSKLQASKQAKKNASRKIRKNNSIITKLASDVSVLKQLNNDTVQQLEAKAKQVLVLDDSVSQFTADLASAQRMLNVKNEAINKLKQDRQALTTHKEEIDKLLALKTADSAKVSEENISLRTQLNILGIEKKNLDERMKSLIVQHSASAATLKIKLRPII